MDDGGGIGLKKRSRTATRHRRAPPQLARPKPASIPTLADVARHAGVGLSTVSRVLRNRGSFSRQVQQSVMAATQDVHLQLQKDGSLTRKFTGFNEFTQSYKRCP